jgi:hypothetical protein
MQKQCLNDIAVTFLETPFISNIGKGKTSSYKTEWLTDTLASATLNQKSEAASA